MTGDCEQNILDMIKIVEGEGGSDSKLDAVRATLQWEGTIPVIILVSLSFSSVPIKSGVCAKKVELTHGLVICIF